MWLREVDETRRCRAEARRYIQTVKKEGGVVAALSLLLRAMSLLAVAVLVALIAEAEQVKQIA